VKSSKYYGDRYGCNGVLDLKSVLKGDRSRLNRTVFWYSFRSDCRSRDPFQAPASYADAVYFLREDGQWLRPIVDDRPSAIFLTEPLGGQPSAISLSEAIERGEAFFNGRRLTGAEKCLAVCELESIAGVGGRPCMPQLERDVTGQEPKCR
jgi:hypothetical protein